MFHKILVCSDGSPCAHNAVRMGAHLAQQLGASILLLNVFDPGLLEEMDNESSLSIPGSSIEDIVCSQHEAAQTDAAPIFASVGVSPQYLHERGHPVGTIVEVAQRESCDLIVLGQHGRSGMKTLLFGSVSEGVLRHASCSVLIVPGNHSDNHLDNQPDYQEAMRTPTFQQLLLASDASADAHKATEVAVELAAKFHAGLTILNVYEEPGLLAGTADAFTEFYPQEHEQRVLQAIENSMQAAVSSTGIACTLRKEKGHVVETILRIVSAEKPDMVVVGHRGRGGFQALLLGSVSNRVARNAICPVLVTR